MAEGARYSIREADLQRDGTDIRNVWRGNLGDASRFEWKYRWFYESAPLGEPLTLILACSAADEAAAQPVGVATAGRRRFVQSGRTLDAGVLVDLAVLPAHRTLGPALRLQKSMIESGLQRADVLYGFPNPKAAPVFQRAGYRKLGAMTRYVKVLRPSVYLRRRFAGLIAAPLGVVADLLAGARFAIAAFRAPRLQWAPLSAAPLPEHDGHEGIPDGLLRGERNARFWQWRFDTPGEPVEQVRTGDAGGSAAWIVQRRETILHVVDCCPRLLLSSAAAAWRALFRDARRKGYSSVAFECLAPAGFRTVLASLGFAVRGDRPVFAAARNDGLLAAEWYLTGADEDE
jgi:hypothetical protein